jgi:hypothetical protein
MNPTSLQDMSLVVNENTGSSSDEEDGAIAPPPSLMATYVHPIAIPVPAAAHVALTIPPKPDEDRLSGQKKALDITAVDDSQEHRKIKRSKPDDSVKKKLTMIQRSELLEEFRKGNIKKTDLATQYGISKPRVTQIIAEAAKIDDAMKHIVPGSNVRRVVNSKFKEVNDALLDWIRDKNNVPVDLEAIKSKATQIAEERQVQGFSPNYIWFQRFQAKHNLIKRPGDGESYILDESGNRGFNTSKGKGIYSINDVISTFSELQQGIKTGYGLDDSAVRSIQESLNRSKEICVTASAKSKLASNSFMAEDAVMAVGTVVVAEDESSSDEEIGAEIVARAIPRAI